MNIEQSYRDIIENIQIIVLKVDQAGQILFINDFGAVFFGYQPSELIASSLQDTLLPQFESTGRNLWELLTHAFEHPEGSRQIQCEAVKKDGRRVWIEWINHFQEDSLSGQTAVVAVGVDITERKRIEALARKSEERRQRDRLFAELVTGHISEAEFFRSIGETGFTLQQPLFCCLIVFDASDERAKLLKKDTDAWQARVDTAIDFLFSCLGGVAWYTGHGIAILQHCPPKATSQARYYAMAWVDKVLKVTGDVFRGICYTIGISAIHGEIKTVYRQAYEAARVGPVFYPDKQEHYWHELGVSRLLAELAQSPAGGAFIFDYLGPLLDKPSARNEEWLRTLIEILSGDSMTVIAERLYIHAKTLAFRKRKLAKMLQVNLDNPEERLNIAIALKLKQLREKL